MRERVEPLKSTGRDQESDLWDEVLRRSGVIVRAFYRAASAAVVVDGSASVIQGLGQFMARQHDVAPLVDD